MTVNQIILLLDIHRGTNTQSKLGTYVEDLNVLINKKLIEVNLVTPKDFQTTEEGESSVKIIKAILR